MFDMDWERSVPIFDINERETAEILSSYDSSLTLKSMELMRTGCRNSNYMLTTNLGRLLLRFVPGRDINNEEAAYQALNQKVSMPALLYHTQLNSSVRVFVYEYIDGINLQQQISNAGCCSATIIEQAAANAAAIHSVQDTSMFADFDVPPFETWYELFLHHQNVRDRIGNELHKHLQKLVDSKRDMLGEIDRYHSLIHCDFRPANMLICRGKLYIIDWEYAGFGHTLADIGQFFRYRHFYTGRDLKLFESVYSERSGVGLPDCWIEMSLLRDMINPLQMMCGTGDAPHKYADLRQILADTVQIFGC